MNGIYAYGKYDTDGKLIAGNLYGDDSLVNITEDEARKQFKAFMALADAFGVKGKTTLFRLEELETLENV